MTTKPAPCATRLARYHDDVDTAFLRLERRLARTRDFRASTSPGISPDIAVPILALQGADDPYGTDEQLRVFEAEVPVRRSRAELVPGASHSPHLEAKDATLAAIVIQPAFHHGPIANDRFSDRPEPLPPLEAVFRWASRPLTMDVDPAGGLFDGYELKLNSYDLGVDIELADAVQRLRFEHPGSQRGRVAIRQGERVLRRRQHPHARQGQPRRTR